MTLVPNAVNVFNVSAVNQAGSVAWQTVSIVQGGLEPRLLCPPDVVLQCGIPAPQPCCARLLNCLGTVQQSEAFVAGCGRSGTLQRTFSTSDCPSASACTQSITFKQLQPTSLECPTASTLACDVFASTTLPQVTCESPSHLFVFTWKRLELCAAQRVFLKIFLNLYAKIFLNFMFETERSTFATLFADIKMGSFFKTASKFDAFVRVADTMFQKLFALFSPLRGPIASSIAYFAQSFSAEGGFGFDHAAHSCATHHPLTESSVLPRWQAVLTAPRLSCSLSLPTLSLDPGAPLSCGAVSTRIFSTRDACQPSITCNQTVTVLAGLCVCSAVVPTSLSLLSAASVIPSLTTSSAAACECTSFTVLVHF